MLVLGSILFDECAPTGMRIVVIKLFSGGLFSEILRDRSMFVRKDSRIFGNLLFLGGRLRRSGASLSGIGGDEAYPALYLADRLR